ncbi:MAG: hypothetical protein V4658_08175, partial [Bacteroidota bacterium]
KSELVKKQQEAALLITAQIETTAQFCANHNIRYHLIIHPVPHEIRTPDSTLALLKKTLSQKAYTIDICKEMTAFYQAHDLEKYSLPKNGHFNSMGYWAMGEIIYKKLPR